MRIKITIAIYFDDSNKGEVIDQLCNFTQRDCKVTPGTTMGKSSHNQVPQTLRSYIRSNSHHFHDLTFFQLHILTHIIKIVNFVNLNSIEKIAREVSLERFL